jgi:16S rRNA C1402 N4-methylase RsmH
LVVSKQVPGIDLNNTLANPGTSVKFQHYSDGILVDLGIAMQRLEQENSGTFRLKFAYRML